MLQLLWPHDAGVEASIKANLEPWPASWDGDGGLESLVSDPLQEATAAYFKAHEPNCFYRYLASAFSNMTLTVAMRLGSSYTHLRHAIAQLALG